MLRSLCVLAFLIPPVLICTSIGAVARTWYVSADGTGDAPNIAAAIDSTVSGDVIIVGAGTHYLSGVLMKPMTSLRSQSGPTMTFLRPNGDLAQPRMVGLQTGCTLSGFDIQGGALNTVGTHGIQTEVSYNVISASVTAVLAAGEGSIHHNVCIGGYSSIALSLYSGDLQIFNNILPSGLYSNNSDCPPVTIAYCNLINGEQNCFFGYYNFSADPQFCGSGNYYLQNDSPCAPGNHPGAEDCGAIGPLPVGCGPVSVHQKTWGAVKALYRK